MIRFSLLKIPVTIHWMFWLLACFIGGGLSAQTAQQWQQVLIFMAAVLVSIIVHELGHALTGIKFGARSPEIQLHGMGGVARFGSGSLTRTQKIIMTAAGPGASIALAIAFILFGLLLFPNESVDTYGQALVAYFINIMVTINIFWTIINLFPVLPLDGGQILRDLLGPSRLKTTCIVSFITLACLATLLWIGTQSIYNLAIMFFLGTHTWSVYQSAR